MKQHLLIVGTLLVTSILSMPTFSIRENPQDPPRGKDVTKHISIQKIDNDGNKIIIDTILGINDIFVWNGDTIGGKSAIPQMLKSRVNIDSFLQSMSFNIEYETDDDGENKIFVFKSGKGGNKAIHKFITDGDSIKTFKIEVDTDDFFGDHNVIVWNDDENETFFAPDISKLPHLSNMSKVMIREKTDKDNVIDLSDPGIISYKKKKNKDGTEKITIVRKQPTENKTEKVEELIINPGNGDPNLFFGRYPEIQLKEQFIKAEEDKDSD